MRVLVDHCVYGKTVRLLRAHGCEVVTLHELGQADASDGEVLALAQSLGDHRLADEGCTPGARAPKHARALALAQQGQTAENGRRR
jgi:hypothetical protein